MTSSLMAETTRRLRLHQRRLNTPDDNMSSAPHVERHREPCNAVFASSCQPCLWTPSRCSCLSISWPLARRRLWLPSSVSDTSVPDTRTCCRNCGAMHHPYRVAGLQTTAPGSARRRGNQSSPGNARRSVLGNAMPRDNAKRHFHLVQLGSAKPLSASVQEACPTTAGEPHRAEAPQHHHMVRAASKPR